MTIRISSCGDYYNIRIVGSLFCGNDEFSFLLYQSLRGRPFAKRWKHPWGAKQSIVCNFRYLDCHIIRHGNSLIPCNDGNGGRLCSKFRMTDRINPFSIVESYSIAIFCKYFLKDFYNIISVIRNRENSIICFTFKWNSMRFEPFSTLSWRKFPKCLFYKITPPSIFGEEDFFIIDSSCKITSSSTRNNNLISWSFIFFENLDMTRFRFRIFEYSCNSHQSCRASSDDCDIFHIMSI